MDFFAVSFVRRAEDVIQKLTDEHVKKVDAALEEKEKDLMAI